MAPYQEFTNMMAVTSVLISMVTGTERYVTNGKKQHKQQLPLGIVIQMAKGETLLIRT